ncbi:hypothetical protein [Patulibacter defluvii]|uniref:hypothetical protein n=1 Tax=Patulibacter defluvii TaxID=3095358 RepID=UPI002A7558E6|nr:hypothetical protein [Patulibacter sp. DM4]
MLEPRPTLVVSDLHLGTASGIDVLRAPGAARERLLAALDGVGRLVIAGDLLELRHGPAATILDRARELLGAIGRRLGPEGEVVLLAGNHDHRLVRPWIERRRQQRIALGTADLAAPDEVSPIASAIAGALGGPRLRIAYPGAWLLPPGADGGGGVYVTHGHYQDALWRMPTIERLIAGVVARAQRTTLDELRAPEDFERLLTPGYGWMDGMAEYARGRAVSASQRTSAGVWEHLREGRGWRGRATRIGVPAAVRTLRRAGLGDLEHRITPETLRIAGLRGMARMLDALAIRADHVIAGHLHRAGPLPGDAAWEWRLEHGGQLWNAGCWVHANDLVSGSGPDSPYWPGRAVRVEPDGGVRLLRLLDDLADPWAGQSRPAPAVDPGGGGGLVAPADQSPVGPLPLDD